MTLPDRQALNGALVAVRFAVGDAPADVIAVLVAAIAMTANRTGDPAETILAAAESLGECIGKMRKRSGT